MPALVFKRPLGVLLPFLPWFVLMVTVLRGQDPYTRQSPRVDPTTAHKLCAFITQGRKKLKLREV